MRWKASASDGGASITGYQVLVYKGSKVVEEQLVSADTRSTTVSGLKLHTNYLVAVRAENSAGFSKVSAKDPVKIQAPGKVKKPTASAKGKTSISVEWKAPKSLGGPKVAGYEVRVYKGSKLIDTVAAKASKRSVSLTKLKAGTTYKIAVRAKNAAGWSSLSAKDTVTTKKQAVAKPSAPVTLAQRNAVESAKSYLSFMAFSRSGLIDQLEFEGFSTKDATFAVDYVSPNWNRQAAEKAQAYLDFMAFSRQGLVDQLLFEGFTPKQAEFGVEAVGY